MTDQKHATLAPSAAERWTNCAGSVAFLATIPDPKPGKAAEEGTRAHAVLEHCLRNAMRDATPLVGQVLPSFKRTDPPIPQDMADAINWALEYVWPMIDAPGAKLLIETRVYATRIDAQCWGTGDIAVLHPDRWLDAVDYKHGVGVNVEADDNKQVTIYGLGFMELYAAAGIDLAGVRMHIVQPRRMDGGGVKTVTLSKADLLDSLFALRRAAKATRDPNARLKAGPWCDKTFCKGRATCPALRKAATSQAIADFGDRVDVTSLSAEELGKRLRSLPMLKAWAKAIEEAAETEARAGRMPAGFKYVEGRGSRDWSGSEAETIAALARLSNAEFAPRKLLSVAQAEKIAGTKLKSSEGFQSLWVRRPGSPVLAPVEDKRPALAKVAAEDFEPISIDD